jgi:hypothetical protein
MLKWIYATGLYKPMQGTYSLFQVFEYMVGGGVGGDGDGGDYYIKIMR